MMFPFPKQKPLWKFDNVAGHLWLGGPGGLARFGRGGGVGGVRGQGVLFFLGGGGKRRQSNQTNAQHKKQRPLVSYNIVLSCLKVDTVGVGSCRGMRVGGGMEFGDGGDGGHLP